MKDKIISFILMLIILAIIAVVGIFGYTIYVELMGEKPSIIDFQGIRKSIFWRGKKE